MEEVGASDDRAVGARVGDLLQTGLAVPFGLVDDLDRYAETGLETWGDESRDSVGGSAGAERHDHLDAVQSLGEVGGVRRAVAAGAGATDDGQRCEKKAEKQHNVAGWGHGGSCFRVNVAGLVAREEV